MRNSGNAVFSVSGRTSATALEKEIAEAIDADLGLDVKVLVRTAAELAGIVGGNPFPTADPKRTYVAFLSGKPATKKPGAGPPACWRRPRPEIG